MSSSSYSMRRRRVSPHIIQQQLRIMNELEEQKKALAKFYMNKPSNSISGQKKNKKKKEKKIQIKQEPEYSSDYDISESPERYAPPPLRQANKKRKKSVTPAPDVNDYMERNRLRYNIPDNPNLFDLLDELIPPTDDELIHPEDDERPKPRKLTLNRSGW